ncbi:MAG: hypothetical protein IJ515_00160 [Clostridia bacterium]|nr:hypothetical protein [Clostridia bacterium]
MNVENLIKSRNIPELLRLNCGRAVENAADFEIRKKEIKKLLQEEIYGVIPKKPDHMQVSLASENPVFCAGKADRKDLIFTVTVGEAEASFPVISVIPKGKTSCPAFVFMNFSPDSPDKYLPIEEIVDSGFAVFSFCHKEVTSDSGDFKHGIAPLFRKSRTPLNAPGKIAMWAWAAMRVMDYVETLDSIDLDNVAVVGHSRLGKTALLAGGFDERFKYVISNDSGCSGAALSRGKQGESVAVITNVFPYWFCPRYVANAATYEERGYDQHFLLALTAPRVLMVGSAEEDLWADPESEFLCTAAASEAFRLYGNRGLVHNDEVPTAKSVLDEGDILYHVRRGTHYMSREDWQEYMKYITKMMESK